MLAVALTLSLGFTACDVETDEEPGGVAIQNMCGYWDVSVSQVDENGNVVWEPDELFGVVDVPFYTFNTAGNSTTEMWVDDQGEFWDYKFKVNIDYDAGTFSATDVVYHPDFYDLEEDERETATITDGKIMLGKGHNIHGLPCDSISFYIEFSDDPYGSAYGYAKHLVTGVRHSGFTE